jgi:aspartyl-tRNA(Asn)/glutamyl-tRNA(Gln) amidotransferase subunit A
MTELPDLPVAALAEAFATGAASPAEAARAVLERIDAWEPTLRAVTHRDDAAALRAAAEAEARWRAARRARRRAGDDQGERRDARRAHGAG